MDENKPDMVNQPPHYAGHTGIEAMDALESCIGSNALIFFYWGNAFKYLWRWSEKNGIEDLRKCRYYIDAMIQWAESHNTDYSKPF